MPLLFAYGTAILRSQMERRLMGNRPSGRAVLPGYKLSFKGRSLQRHGAVADLEEAEASAVPGFLYELPESQAHAVDRCEGVEPGLYEAFEVPVLKDDGSSVEATAYRLRERTAPHGTPNPAYVLQMRQGCREWGLSEEALEEALARSR